MEKYTEWVSKEEVLKIEGWARDGLTNDQIAKNIGINPDPLYTWIKKYPDISEALKRGKEVVDRMVENALFKRALGYEYTERTGKVVDRDKDVLEPELFIPPQILI
jgi:hypothetical protein